MRDNTQLAKISEFETMLATIDNLHDARRMLSLAQGLVTTARKEYVATDRAGEVKDDRDRAYDTAVKAGELRLMAEAKLGELILRERQDGGLLNNGQTKRYHEGTASLADIGLSKKEGIRATTIAGHKDLIPEVVATAIKNDDIPTRKALERLITQRIPVVFTPEPNRYKDLTYPPIITKTDCKVWLQSQLDCDLLLTDPPYSTDLENVNTFAQEWLPLALSKVKPTGRAYICIGAYPEELRAYLNVANLNLTLANILVWTYRNTLGPSPAHDYKLNWQAILYFRGKEAPPLDCPIMLEQFTVQDINAPDGRLGDRCHTWQKPDLLAEHFIRHSTKEGGLVLDCFAGTGTFLLTAARLNRQSKGCDNSDNMIKLAIERGCMYEG